MSPLHWVYVTPVEKHCFRTRKNATMHGEVAGVGIWKSIWKSWFLSGQWSWNPKQRKTIFISLRFGNNKKRTLQDVPSRAITQRASLNTSFVCSQDYHIAEGTFARVFRFRCCAISPLLIAVIRPGAQNETTFNHLYTAAPCPNGRTEQQRPTDRENITHTTRVPRTVGHHRSVVSLMPDGRVSTAAVDSSV